MTKPVSQDPIGVRWIDSVTSLFSLNRCVNASYEVGSGLEGTLNVED